MRRPTSLPRAGLAALAVVLATEAAFLAGTDPLTGLPVFQPTVDDATLTVKRRMLPLAAGAVVLTGDSSCTMGLRPDVLRDEAGLSAVNLGTLSSFTLPGFADLTAEALDRPDPPRAVVVALLPRSFGVSEADARGFGLLGRYLVATGRRPATYRVTADDWRAWFMKKHRLNIFPPEFGGSYAAYEREAAAGGGFFPERGTYRGTPPDRRADRFEATDY
ncbi:MAG TPA: hypothetical protein VH092_38065, partial [Urbifossiella sp.]|nr:hypothetical protein [Urbifossiella sp.]